MPEDSPPEATTPLPLTHALERASSGRARCRACGRGIDKGTWRVAECVPNPVADGTTSHFYHPRCAADRRPPVLLDLAEKIRELAPELAELLPDAEQANRHRRLPRLGVLSQAPTGRAKCRHCASPIETGGWRVALQPIEEGRLQAWGFVHLRCVDAYVECAVGGDRLLRYTDLTPEQRAAVLATRPE